MADQKRWFKLWCSVLTDDDLQSLPPADRWAWAALGCHVKQAGTRGRASVSLTNAALAGALGVPLEVLLPTLQRLPHVRVEEGNPVNGKVTVTFDNWYKYQEDSTVAERVRRLRSKRRGEKEENKTKTTPLRPPTELHAVTPWKLSDQILDALRKTRFAALEPDQRWWQSQFRAHNGVNMPKELLAAEAWCASSPDRAPRKNLRRFLNSWFARAKGDQA